MLYNNFTEEYRSFHIILQNQEGIGALLLGDLNAASDAQGLESNKVKTVITAAAGLQHLQIPPSITHIVFPLMDIKSENILQYFQLAYQVIDENLKKGAVLVHCGAGISRSATLVIAYYMKKHQVVFSVAIDYVRRIRPNICPNLGFELQLKKYQQQLGLVSSKNRKNISKNAIHTIENNKLAQKRESNRNIRETNPNQQNKEEQKQMKNILYNFDPPLNYSYVHQPMKKNQSRLKKQSNYPQQQQQTYYNTSSSQYQHLRKWNNQGLQKFNDLFIQGKQAQNQSCRNNQSELNIRQSKQKNNRNAFFAISKTNNSQHNKKIKY